MAKDGKRSRIIISTQPSTYKDALAAKVKQALNKKAVNYEGKDD